MSPPGSDGPSSRHASDANDAGQAEPGSTGLPAARSRASFSRGVDLGRLAERDTPLTWFEAVAIVQELCAVLLATRGAGPAPDLEPGDVAITPEGGVEVRDRVAPGLPAVAQVAHLLLTLLGEAETLPVQLRLLALQEVSPTPGSTTLREWSARLATFERPGRQRTIREVYERFTRLPAHDAIRPPKQPAGARRARPARPPWWRNRTVQSAAASVALVVAAGLAAAWLWREVVPFLSGRNGRDKPDAGAAQGGESLSAEAVERIFAAARRIWLGAGAGPAAPAESPTLEAKPISIGAPAGLPAGPSQGPAAASRPPEAGIGARTAVVESTVFSAADAEVVPPLLVRPHLRTSPSPGVRAEDLPQVEILVSPAGEVESVKLVTPSAGVKSAMMLSAIKTWRFEPAKRGGQPVRYRLLMRLTNQ